MYRAALVAVAIVGCATGAEAQQPSVTLGPSKVTPVSPERPLGDIKKPTLKTLEEMEKSPLLIYFAHGEDGMCGPDCREWIAVEGVFDRNAAARFRDFVVRLGRRSLPVFFDSPGGGLEPAQAIGAFMRQRGMTAGVAKTLPEICSSADTRSCESAKKSGKRLSATWTSIGAQCSSACVYALLGARERLVSPGSLIAIHAPRVVLCALTDGTRLNPNDPRCAHVQTVQKASTLRYVRQMGTDPGLVESAYQVPHESLQILSRAQLLQFGVVRNELNVSPWMLLDEERLIVSFVEDLSDLDGVRRQAGAVALGCQRDGGVLFIYFRPSNRPDIWKSSASLVSGEHKLDLSYAGTSRFSQLERDGLFHRYAALLPPKLVDPPPISLADPSVFEPKIEIQHGELPDKEPPTVVHPRMDGFRHSWAKLRLRCATN